ncbi:hypothetical protein [Agrobacterium cavarae]
MANQLNFKGFQIDRLREITNNGKSNFADGYNYITSIIGNSQVVDASTKFWFKKAEAINRNEVKDAASFFIRDVSRLGLEWDGKSTSGISNTSDIIGARVILDVLNAEGVPPLSKMLSNDISVALRDGGLTIGGWGGSFYYWNMAYTDTAGRTATVGARILESPLEYEKFIAVNAEAMSNTLVSEGYQIFELNSEFIEIATAGWGAEAPKWVKLEIFERAVSIASAAGSPNYIDGWVYIGGKWFSNVIEGVIEADAATSALLDARRAVRLEKQGFEFSDTPYCFPAWTKVTLVSGETCAISDIQPGDEVLAFSETGLESAKVLRAFRNVTQEWLKLEAVSQDDRSILPQPQKIEISEQVFVDREATYVTPGHAFLNEFGRFENIESIVKRGGQIVRANGKSTYVRAERILYSEATAHMFDCGESVQYCSAGGNALAPIIETGWATYNFEVERLHTYIADGWRVHNDSQAVIDNVGAMGQAFGTHLANILTEGESQFVQLTAGTALGVVTRNLAEVIMDTGFHLFTGQQLDFGTSLSVAIRQLEDIHLDLATAAAGTVSSFLLAELGEVLGLEGFGADLFSVTAGTYVGSVLNTAIGNIAANKAILSGADFTKALGALPGSIGTFFGSALASKILPAESIEGVIGGSLGSIAGSALGSTALGALGSSLGLFGNFLLPGIGAFFGSLIGTFLGNLFGDDPEPHAAIDLFVRSGLSVDCGGVMQVATQYKSVDGFPHDVTIAWAEAVFDVSRNYLIAVGGFELANALVSGVEISDVLIRDYGFHEGELVRLLQQMRIDVDNNNNMKFFVNNRQVDSAEQMIDGAIAGFVKGSQVIGGDLLLKRAAQNSAATDTSTLSGDMAVAEEYTKYLNERGVINTLIASQPGTAFAAAWAITLAQTADLDLAEVGISDFNGGLKGFLASLAYAGLSVNANDVTLSQDVATGKITIEIKVGDDVDVPGAVDVFADHVETVTTEGGRTLRLVFDNFMSNAGYHHVTGTATNSGGTTNVTGVTTGRDIWFAPGNANYVVEDTGKWLISAGQAEIISSDDILIGGAGNDSLSGAEGWDWIVGGAGNDTLDGGSEADVLMGGDGNDILRGGWDLDYLEGGAGADTLIGGEYDLDWDTAGYSGSNAAVSINLKTGAASGGHAAGDTFSGIVNLVGSKYNDVLIGNEYRNSLEGGAGADILDGGTNLSSQIFDFASYFRSSKAVIASLADQSINTGDAAGDVYINITGLEGSAFDDVLYGDDKANDLWGHGGNDVLVVGAGADVAFGSFGFDIMSYRNLTTGITWNLENWTASSAIVADDVGVGIDAYEATDHNDTIIGRSTDNAGLYKHDVIFARAGDDNIQSGAGDDLIDAGSGNDTLNGGSGADTMRGGAGDDLYIVDNAGDIVDEETMGSAGTDTVQSSISFSLVASKTVLGSVENLTLLGTDHINGEGNALNNIIIGNSGNNILTGGSGKDTMRGGAGNDIYVVDDASDIVDEAAAGSTGTDTVQSSITYSLATSATVLGSIENLTLIGTGNIDGAGNAGNNVILGNVGDNLLDGGAGVDTMRGGAGNDTYVVDNASDVVDEAAAGSAGTDTVRSSISYSLVTSTTVFGSVENLTLTGTGNINGTGNTGNNVIIGNSGSNLLIGGAGKDMLDGGAGADTMRGGADDDVYVVDSTSDIVDEAASGSSGVDTVQSSISYSLVASATLLGSVENLTLTGNGNIVGTGNTANNVLIGNSGNNLLIGDSGNDTLDGGAGADTMRGGADDDIYVVDNTSDVVDEAESGSSGTDTVRSSISYSLVASAALLGSVENLTLTGSGNINGTGNSANNVIIGNSGNNVLIGDAGSDTLDGGAGTDTMRGGANDDIYIVDEAGDVVDEAVSGSSGIDTVQSSINFSLVTSATVLGTFENLTLIGTNNINGTGNAANNVIIGNVGNNLLDGGSGADTMRGGAGDDVYVVGNTGDIVDEAANGSSGNDTVQSSITFSLATSSTVLGVIENLTLIGSSHINGTGNASNNIIIGNTGNNTLNGGSGVDVMRGGAGNDIYVVDNAGDIVDEAVTGSSGTDTVQSAISFSLAASANVLGSVENLTLTGTSNTNGTGNAANNVIIGNSGNNLLVGDAGNDTLNGGAGVDTMRGGAGNDIYVVDNAGDVIDEAATGSSGTDTVQSSISYSLVASATVLGSVENLTLTGTGNINGTGNSGTNVIRGNSGNNVLSGGGGNDTLNGGEGVDTMRGGAGNDIYVVDNIGDIVDEAETGSSGADTVQSTISYSLVTSSTVLGLIENLTLIGSSNINGTGNGSNNVLVGNTGNNILNGGAGSDVITTGSGNDVIVFKPNFGLDTVTDFQAGAGSADVLEFDTSLFADFEAVLAAAAQVGNDTVITYDASNTVTLKNVALTSLHDDDVRFVA